MPKMKSKKKNRTVGKTKHTERYQKVGPSRGGRRKAFDGDDWLYLDRHGKPAFAERFDEASNFVFEHGQWLAWVRKNGLSYQINTHGTKVD